MMMMMRSRILTKSTWLQSQSRINGAIRNMSFTRLPILRYTRSRPSLLSTVELVRAASSDRSFVALGRLERLNCLLSKSDYCLVHLETPKHLSEIPKPFDCNIVVGSCGGILVLRNDNTRAYALSNPKTGKHRIVPPNPAGDENVVFAGFGGRRDRYNLVTIIGIPEPSQGFKVHDLMVYDVVRGTWRHIEHQPDEDDIKHWDEFLYADGDCLYLKVGHAGDEVIEGFDLEREEFFQTDLPDFVHEFRCSFKSSVAFDGNLCLLCIVGEGEGEGEKERLEVWVAKEKRSSCWTRLFSISDPGSIVELCDEKRYIIPLVPMCYSACRNKVLFEVRFDELAWYNLETKEFEKFEFEPSDGVTVSPVRSRVY